MGDEAGTKRCPMCAETIKLEAIRCRFCGSDLTEGGRQRERIQRGVEAPRAPPVIHVKMQRQGLGIMQLIRGLISLMVFGILATAVGTCVLCGTAANDVMQADHRRSAAVATAAPETIVAVSSDQLHADYEANEVSADQRYRGHVLRVTGAVQAIRKDIFDHPYVELWTTNEFQGAHAMFDDGGGLAGISVSQHVTVRCIGDNVVMGSPILKNCVLE